ncbi:MAG: FimV/HubP family polar landmark protein [Pseudomonadota bacterium]
MHRWLAALICGLTLMLSQTAAALGLGEITARSALNEPMRAEIQLLGATRDELRNLEVRLAPAETFERNGIVRAGFLSRLRFRVRPERAVVEVTSTQPITEPFVTLLVEVVWPRGRLLREYTILLDPPTYAAPSASNAAPVTRNAAPAPASGGVIQRPGRPSNAASPAPTQRPAFNGSQYQVQRNDTLWEIANRIRPEGTDINQTMLALYEANPGAFDGNINLLRAGATLQVPSEQELFAINRQNALAEVRRQNQSWRGTGSLTLVAPDEDTDLGGLGSGGSTSSASASDSGEAQALRSELQAAERQLALRNAELARLREQLAVQQRAESEAAQDDDEPVVAAVEPEPEVPDTTEADAPLYGEYEPAAEDSTEVFAESTETQDGDTTEAAAEPEPEPVAARPQVSTPTVTTTPASESLIDQILGSMWTYVAAGVALVLALLGVAAVRRRSESDTTGTWEALDASDLEDLDGTLAATGRLRELNKGGDTIRKPIEAPALEDAMEQTSPVDEVPTPSAAPAAAPSEEFNIEDTFSSDTAINLDQSDPLAEADFHMAYGLFDQAADLINGALAVDSSDVRLQQKLCEIYFQWGKQDGFVDAAQKLKASVPANDPAWNSVLIMGQQIAPAHEMFSGAVVSGGSGDLDLSFDETRALEAADIDAAIEPASGNTGTFEEVFSGDGDTGTVEQLADMSGIDFEFDETLASSNESSDETEEAPIDFGDDDAAIDFSLDGLDDELETSSGGDTVEQPVDLDDLDADIENTAEREGIDLSAMSVLDESTEAMTETTGDATAEIGADLLDATGVTSVLPDDFKVDLPSEPEAVSDDAETLLADTSGLVLDDLDLDAGDAADSTNIMPLANNDGEVDLDVADLTSELRVDDISAATQELPAGNGDATLFSDEVFAGDADSDADTGLNLALDDTGETNVAEVGTKLDLARAYVDMGDPEGARSILKEVMNEGDESQQAEAQKLLEALGA